MIRVGPSGWSWEDQEGIVYPPKKGSKFDPLVYLVDFFDTMELNNTKNIGRQTRDERF